MHGGEGRGAGGPEPQFRPGCPGPGPVRGLAVVGDDGGAAGAARTATARLPPALAGHGAARAGPPRAVAAADPVPAPRLDPGLPQPRAGWTHHRRRRPAGPGPRDPHRTGRLRGGTGPDRAVRPAGARGGLAAAGRPGGDPGPAGGSARAVLAAADRAPLAAGARPAPGRRGPPDPVAGRLRPGTGAE